MRHLAFMLVLLLLVGHTLAQEEETEQAEQTTAATDDMVEVVTSNGVESVGASNVVEVVTSNGVDSAGASNVVESAQSTNSADEAEAELLGLRDPFWPVGYEPAPPEPEVSEEELDEDRIKEAVVKKIKWPPLLLKGITRAGKDRYMAIIAGVGLVETGQTISIRKDDMLYSWLIEEVNAKGVDFTRLEARPYQHPTIGVRTQ